MPKSKGAIKCLFSFYDFIGILDGEILPMLMMCWFYCGPLVKGLFFALSPLLIVFAFFILKRGIRQSRLALRQGAFILIFLSILKILILDLYLLRESLLCKSGWLQSGCTATGFIILQVLGLVVLVSASLFLFKTYHSFIRNPRQLQMTSQQAHLDLWANMGMGLAGLLIIWLAAPWIGYLTVGHVPQLFMQVPWQLLAFVDMLVLLTGFWKLEDCRVVPYSVTRNRKSVRVWTPKDTLNLAVILFVITAALSYVSSDVLSPK